MGVTRLYFLKYPGCTSCVSLTKEVGAQHQSTNSMGILRGQGLYKEIDNGIQLRYVYQKDNIKPLVQRVVLLIISILIYMNFMEKATKICRLWFITVFLVVNYFFPINRETSVSVSQGIGLEVSETSGTIFAQTTHEFIITNKIIDVVILEGFRGLEVVFYLACIVEDHPKLVLILQDAPLMLDEMKIIRHDIRKIILK